MSATNHDATLDRVQAAMRTALGHPDEIAKALLYIVDQPIEINIEELVIRPGKALSF